MPSLSGVQIGIIFALFIGVWVLLWLLNRKNKKLGAVEHANKTQAATAESVKSGKQAVDRLNTDPEYAKKIRDKYTRQDP